MPLSFSRLMTDSLRSVRWGKQVSQVLAAALGAVEPGKAVERAVQRDGGRLLVNGVPYDLDRFEHIYLVGAGKAGAPMAKAICQILGENLTGGTVIVKEGYRDVDGECILEKVELLEARHPIPDERGIQGTQQIIELLKQTTQNDLVICILSGGGSALMVSPAAGIRLSDLQNLTSALLSRGATINEINTIRKHLDTVKGGGLARMAHLATKVTLILSDVVGDPLDVVASGPTVPDSSTYSQAYGVLEQFDLLNTVPIPVISHLKDGMRGELPETPKVDDPLFRKVQNVIVGSNLQAARAALEQARRLGMNTLLLTTFLQGEARQAGRVLAAVARQLASTGDPIPRPACIVCGGETTVTLSGSGQGGRNQEMALGTVFELADLSNVALVCLATDGGDGPTDAAGAVVTGGSLERARLLSMNPAKYLAHNDSYAFFEALGDLLKPGPTQTNVNDLSFVFAF